MKHKKLNLHLPDENATLALGKQLARIINQMHFVENPAATLIIYLSGELGAGKTSLVRSIFRGLGYVGAIKSPTYTLVESYQLHSITIHHFDFYRIQDAGELAFIGVDEYFSEH